VFADLCSKCHTIARAINSDFALEEDWERYIRKMMRRGKGVITPAAAAQIYDFWCSTRNCGRPSATKRSSRSRAEFGFATQRFH
jgi:hypothetical protein